MANMNNGLKGIWMKSMEAISETASKIATSTKYKVNEMNIINRRAEILKDFGAKSYKLWQQGEQFPVELDQLLGELDRLEKELSEIRAQREPAKPAAPAEVETEQEPETVEEPAEEQEESVEEIAEEADEELASEVPVIQVEEDAVPETEVMDETKPEA